MAKMILANSHELLRFWLCVLATRALEATLLVTAVMIVTVIGAAHDSPATNPNWGWTLSYLGKFGAIVLLFYYVGFGYIAVSCLAIFAAWRWWRPLSSSQYRNLNVAVFSIHSLGVLLFEGDGAAQPELWFVWFAMVLFNATVPNVLFRSFGLGERSGLNARSV